MQQQEGGALMGAHNADYVRCPHPRCQGTIKVSPGLPAGVYQCICHHCEVRWDGTTLTLETTDA
jgi:hypothetical protein